VEATRANTVMLVNRSIKEVLRQIRYAIATVGRPVRSLGRSCRVQPSIIAKTRAIAARAQENHAKAGASRPRRAKGITRQGHHPWKP
jgi:hypothetical protein